MLDTELVDVFPGKRLPDMGEGTTAAASVTRWKVLER